MSTAQLRPFTYFAPAERVPIDLAGAQGDAFIADGQMATVLDALPSPVLLLNATRQVLFANAAARRVAASLGTTSVVGLRPGELLACREASTAPSGCGTGKGCRTCGAVHAILDALAGRPATEECCIALARGDALDLRVTATPFRWQTQEFVLMVLEDVSDEKRRAVLERTFFHDILNTAGGVSGIAGLIAADATAYEAFRGDLLTSSMLLINEIKCQRMLLSAEQGELVAALTATSTRRVLEDVQHLYAHHPVADGRRIVLDAGFIDAPLETDPTILARVLGNLVKNALEATPPEGVVTLGAGVTDGACAFWCHNPGAIPSAQQPQVFRRNFSTKGPGRGTGTYSVRLFTERYLKGSVAFTSAPGDGTRFTVTLPAPRPPRTGDA